MSWPSRRCTTERRSSYGAAVADSVFRARAYLGRLRLKKGDRCALLAHNSTQWVAMDLAIMAEGLTVVPLYARQAPAELVAMMKDCCPAVIACGEKSLADAIVEAWPECAAACVCFEDVFEVHLLQRTRRMGSTRCDCR
jgi:long-subunit acyl-CoA synthetase (AMP-forming)